MSERESDGEFERRISTKPKPVTFTPGPWRIEYSLECGYVRADCDVCATRGIREPVSIAQLFSMAVGEDHPDRSSANAKLIAAAPELYDALSDLLASPDPPHYVLERARAALSMCSPSAGSNGGSNG